MKILIAGASGFIGKNLVLQAPSSWEICGLYHQNSKFPDFLRKNGITNATPLRCDLRDGLVVRSLFSANDNTFDACVFVVGNSDIGLSARDPLVDLAANITTLINLIQCIRVGKFVFMSSGTVYLGHQGLVTAETPVTPRVPYGITKLASELYIRFFQARAEHIREYVILRFFGAYGPMEPPRKIYTNLLKAFCLEDRNEYTVIGDGKNYIDAMYIDDAVEGLLKVVGSDKGNLVVDFCRGAPLTINELVCEAARVLGKNNLILKHRGASSEYITFYASPDPMERLFGFKARVSLQEGLLRFRDYLLSQGDARCPS